MTMTPADPATRTVADDAAAMWAGVLRDYRVALESQRQILGQVHDERDVDHLAAGVVFAPPSGMPPLPPSMLDEAEALDAETAQLLAEARALLATLKPPSATTPVHRSILAPPSPSQMDTRL